MRTTIDKAGRIVVPKALRDELGLKPGTELEIAAADGRLEIEPVPVPKRLVRRGGRLVIEAVGPIEPLTVDMVRDMIEQLRR